MHLRDRLRRTFLLCLTIFLPIAAPLPAADEIAVFHADPAVRDPLVKFLVGEGFWTIGIDADAAQALAPQTVDLLVIAPGAVYPPEARPALHDFLSSGGSLMVLSPRAFDYRADPVDPVRIADFLREGSDWSVVQPDQGESAFERTALADGRPALALSTARVTNGDLEVQIELAPHRRADRSLILFEARGDFDVEVLRLQIRDGAGHDWVAFVSVGRDWTPHQVSMADFVPLNEKLQVSGARLDPAAAERLSIGIETQSLWPELKGSCGIADVRLAEPSEFPGVPTSELARWGVAAEAMKTRVPEWIIDPFLGSERLASVGVRRAPASTFLLPEIDLGGEPEAWTVPPPPPYIGKTMIDFNEVLPLVECRRLPLLVAGDGEQSNVVAELRLPSGKGPYGRSAFALFGLRPELYDTMEIKSAIGAVVYHLLKEPRILAVTPNTDTWTTGSGDIGLRCAVRIFNPRRTPVEAEVEATLPGMQATSGRIELAPRAETKIDLALVKVSEDFPLARFDWRVRLLNGTEVFDEVADTVDAERTLIRAAQVMVENQRRHADGRLSHHYFADIYGARAMLQAAAYLERPEVRARHAELLEACPPGSMRDAALRFADMIAERQLPTGAIPMGYNEDKGYYYTADNGSVSLGMVQMASWLGDDPRVARYLDCARKYMVMRQSMRQDEAAVARLEAEYGQGSQGIKLGDYGLGYLGSDFYTRKKWPEVRPELRAPFWVTSISIPVAPALSMETGEEQYREIARMDIEHFLEQGYRAESQFHGEAVGWNYLLFRDTELGPRLRALLERDALTTMMTGKEHDIIGSDGRIILRWLIPQYCRRWFGDSASIRAGLVKGLWLAGSESSSYSVRRVGEFFPGSQNGPAVGAGHYAAFGSIVMMELLEPGSTLLRRDGNARDESPRVSNKN